jgi:hypothetical protein
MSLALLFSRRTITPDERALGSGDYMEFFTLLYRDRDGMLIRSCPP